MLIRKRFRWSWVLVLITWSAQVVAEEPAPADHPSMFKSYQVHLGLQAGGPLLFKDTPDARLQSTSAFQFGGHLAFLFGTELRHLHRFGLGLAFATLAKSDTRDAETVTPYLVYEIGHPIVLQAGLGWAIGVGTSNFAENYSGFYAGAALRYSFRSEKHPSPVGVSLGVTGSFVAATKSLQYSTAFLGAQIEMIYHSK